MKRLLVIFLLVFSCFSVYGESGLESFLGYWNGLIEVGEKRIKMEFEILEQQGAVVGKMNAQGVKGIPADVKIDGEKITIEVKQLGIKYSGLMQHNHISGMFSQNGFNQEMALFPGKLEISRPQTPKAPYPYKIEEIFFENGAEKAILTGTITYPVGYEKMKAKNIPVVVMVTGSGTQNRDEEIYDHKPFAVIADWLARNGIASLRYDDRGAGGSSKPVAGATSENNAGDAKAAVEFVRGLGKFGKVGVLGHSEGGTIALMLAGERVPDFIISLAGVATKGVECIVWQNLAQMELQGIPGQIISDYGKALRGIYTQRGKSGAVEQGEVFVQKLCADEGLQLPSPLVSNLVAVATMKSEWLDWFVQYDPAEAVGKIECPVMALNGSLDMQVPAEVNLELLRKLLPADRRHLIKEYPQLNHLMQSCTRETSLSYGDIEETISPQVLEDIVQWVKGL